jgi:hypothetical protein
MRGIKAKTEEGPSAATWAFLFVGVIMAVGCARLPYTTKVLHEDGRSAIQLQQEVDGGGYSHPVQLSPGEVASLLRGYSLREQKSLPLRWFSEEVPPLPAFREDEIQVLAPQLADALQKAGPGERVHFQLFAPGFNPAYYREETSGWVAVRERFFHFDIEYFHAQNPSTKFSHYDWYYPTPPYPPGTYVLYFEPGRFFVQDPRQGTRGVDFREFLKSAIVPKGSAPAKTP